MPFVLNKGAITRSIVAIVMLPALLIYVGKSIQLVRNIIRAGGSMQIKPKGISKKKRTIGAVEFRYFTEVEGRFAHLLPKKEGDEPPTILY